MRKIKFQELTTLDWEWINILALDINDIIIEGEDPYNEQYCYQQLAGTTGSLRTVAIHKNGIIICICRGTTGDIVHSLIEEHNPDMFVSQSWWNHSLGGPARIDIEDGQITHYDFLHYGHLKDAKQMIAMFKSMDVDLRAGDQLSITDRALVKLHD